MSKSKVARESVLEFTPDAKVEALHDSITNPTYGVTFFKGFQLVLNALDNRAARSHVNRMCLAADVPLVESGTAGYLGQVTVIRKGKTECYECQPKPHQKTFPGCTIRNTPSEPIHCIVWSKHLFNQLFGESDPDEDVSPDNEDPELGDAAREEAAEADGNVQRVSTRKWAMDNGYDAKMIFTKLFNEDIKTLLSMDKLWAKRTPPTPLDWDKLSDEVEAASEGAIADQIPWSLKQCALVLESSIGKLKAQLEKSNYEDHLVWDKDDEAAMDFVAACANIRARIFNIPEKTRFDVKSMAGNIIPAIATTNAAIAGGIVMEALKLLFNQEDKCRTVFLTKKINPRRKIMVPCQLNEPNPKCYICSDKNEIGIKLDLEKVTLKTFEDKILKGTLSMVGPDAEVSGTSQILISSDEDDDLSGLLDKTLKDLGLKDGSILSCDDFLQNYKIQIVLYQNSELAEGVEFEIVGDLSKLETKPEAEAENGNGKHENGNGTTKNGSSGDDNGLKRKPENDIIEEIPAKKAKTVAPAAAIPAEEDQDIVCLE